MAERKKGGQFVPTLKGTAARGPWHTGREELSSPPVSVSILLTYTAYVAVTEQQYSA